MKLPWVPFAALLLLMALAQPASAQRVGRPHDEMAELRTRIAALEAQVGRLTALLELQSLEARVEPVPRVAPEGQLPLARQVPGYPWLRVEDGVVYFQPVPVSPELAQLLGSPGGLEGLLAGVDTRWVGDHLVVLGLAVDHVLARHLGVRPGDRLISINERAFPRSGQERRALERNLRGRTRFALELLRGDQRLIAAFYVADKAIPPQPAIPVEPQPDQLYRLVVASQDPKRPGRNSVVLQRHRGGQITLFVGDALDGYLVESIRIERNGEQTQATLVLRSGEESRTLCLNRAD